MAIPIGGESFYVDLVIIIKSNYWYIQDPYIF